MPKRGPVHKQCSKGNQSTKRVKRRTSQQWVPKGGQLHKNWPKGEPFRKNCPKCTRGLFHKKLPTKRPLQKNCPKGDQSTKTPLKGDHFTKSAQKETIPQKLLTVNAVFSGDRLSPGVPVPQQNCAVQRARGYITVGGQVAFGSGQTGDNVFVAVNNLPDTG